MTLKLLQGRHSGLLTERHCLLLWKVLYLTILQHSVTDDKKNDFIAYTSDIREALQKTFIHRVSRSLTILLSSPFLQKQAAML